MYLLPCWPSFVQETASVIDMILTLGGFSGGLQLITCFAPFAVRVWDVRPFAPKERCVKIFQGNVHNFEKVSPAWQKSFTVHLTRRYI